MKTATKLLIMCALLTAVACDKSYVETDRTTEPTPLELSICSDKTINDIDSDREYSYIETAEYDYTFDITSGNGGYQVVEATDCRVSIKGENVVVNMYNQHSKFTLEDSRGFQKSLWIKSSNNLFDTTYSRCALLLHLPDATSAKQHFDFGIGGYTIEQIKGNSAVAELISDGTVEFTPVRRGTTHFVVQDARGQSLPCVVKVSDDIDMRKYFSNVDVVAEDCLVIWIDKAQKWELQSVGYESIFENVTLHRGGEKLNYDYLQVDINADVKVGDSGKVSLKSKDNVTIDINFTTHRVCDR